MNYSKAYIKPTYIYIAVQLSNPEWVKIGMSENPKHRLSNFKVGSPTKDYIITYITPMINRAFARRCELFFKNNFESRAGEWFEMTVAEAISTIERYKTTFRG